MGPPQAPGIPPAAIPSVVGVLKAYTTSVGEGPFPTELNDAIGDQLREIGHEFGASTGPAAPLRLVRCRGRPVRRRAQRLHGMALLKLDPLDMFPVVRICTGYLLDGGPATPADQRAPWHAWSRSSRKMPGWEAPTTAARRFDDLPAAARRYVVRIEELVGVPVRYVGVGPRREELIVLE